LHDYNKALAEALLSLERTGGVIDESNFLIIDKFQQFAEKVGDSSEYVKNINTALNAHVASIVGGKTPEEAKTSISGDIVDKLTESYQGNIEALDKFSKSINKTFTKHQIAFSTIIDKQLSEQSNAYGKFIYNFGKAAAQGGDGGTEGMTNAINEFTGTMRSGLLPALKSLALTSKDFITSEAKALFNGIQLDRTASLQLQEGEQETLRKLTDTKDIWSGMGGGSAEYTQTQLDSQKALKEVIGVDSKQRTKAFEDITHALRSTGVFDTSGNEKANTQNVDKVLYGIQDVVKGGMYNAEQAVEIFKNTAQSTEYLKVASTMDKKRRDAQKDEILTTMKFASALNMSAESAKAFAVAVATAGSNLSPQQMISNVATTGQAQNILDFYAKELGVKSENTDADRERMTAIEQLPAGARNAEDKAFFNEFLLKMVKTNADVQQKIIESANEARDKGDIEGQKKYASFAVQASNQFDTAIAGYSGAEKDIIDAYVKQYPTIDQEAIKKNLKDGESITQAIVRSMDEKKEKTNADLDTKYNNTIVNLSSLAAYWDAFTKNIIGANIGNLATLLFNISEGVGGIMFAVSGFKKILSVLGVGGAIAEGGAAVAGAAGAAGVAEGGAAVAGAAGAAGVAEGGIGALAAAALPVLGMVGGIAMLAYGAKGLYDHAVGNDVIYKADRGDAIHGIVDVNNLDIYTNQTTDAIDTQTQELLKGFTTIMGNPVDINKAINNITDENTPLTDLQVKAAEMSMAMGNELSPIVKSAYELAKSVKEQPVIVNDTKKETPVSTDTSIPFQGYKPYNPPNGNTNIEQPTGVLPSNQINNADISLALDDLKTFLSKELIVGMLSRFDELITNTGDTAKNTGDGGTLGNLVAALTKPASTPFVRGRVEDAATITTS
jgi:hypothetical protein